MNKKILLLTFASLLLSVVPNVHILALDDNQEVDILKDDLKKVEDNKENIKTQISEIQKYIDDTEESIMNIENTLNDTYSKIHNTESKIDTLTKKIFSTQTKISKKQTEINSQKEKLGQTISFMYENKDYGFFQFFFQTQNLSDSLKTLDLINIIADENEKLYESIQIQQNELKEQKSNLERDKKILEKYKSTLTTLKQQQEKQKIQQDTILSQHKDRELKMQNELVEEEKASSEIMQKINEAVKKRNENKGTADIPLSPDQVLVSPLKAGSYTISSVYGYRFHPVLGISRLHNGIDMAAPSGTPIYSAGTGTILLSGTSSGYGNWIVIKHDNGLISIYGHMDTGNLFVNPGQRINQGQLIAKVGNSGISTGSHLHFSIATNYDDSTSTFTYVDPLTVLK
ncbi:peptidoglycan DD-metalloendopeptidase family protein [Bacillus mexicanus]|uniref:murein hydrolase activator EnvC family protein n=1 Tax=Bacillus mexicanus TaxID=2834415 RepID=UPI003D213B70